MHQWPPRHPRAVCNPMPNPGRVRTSAGAPLPSASRALRSFASLARSYSPRACAHRPTRLAAGWSSTTSPLPRPLPPTPSTTALRAAALTDLRPRRPRPRRRPRRPPPCARGCRCHCRPDRPRRRCRRPRRRPPPLPPPPRPAAFNAAALAAALAAASAAAIAAAPSTSTFSPSHCQRLHRHPHRQLPGRGRRSRPFLRMAMVLLEPVPVCGRAVLFLHVLFCGVCFVHRL